MILVFGSLNVDMVAPVPRLPHPGETVICENYVLKPGGKGANQAVAAARAAAGSEVEVHLYGAIGQDPFGDICLKNLEEQGVAVHAITRTGRPTGTAFICVDSRGENLITVASGANALATASEVPEAVLGQGATTVLMQMEVPPKENWALIERARAVGATSILNLAPAGAIPAAALKALDYLVVNEGEAAEVERLLGQDSNAAPDLMARAISDASGAACVITLGRSGAIAAQRGKVWQVGALPIHAVDTTGAGDAFCGTFAVELDAGGTLVSALHRASVAAGLACTRLGAQESSPKADEVSARLKDLPPPALLPAP
ncbi:MAG: ribokinase [Rhodospirillaceae bacterium]|nr:ribokinase [Rhodospirillaceae bacterium]